MKTLSSPIETQAEAEQSGWTELYDIYLKASITTPWGSISTIRLTPYPGGVTFWRPEVEDPSGEQSAVTYHEWPVKREPIAATSKDGNDRFTFYVSNVTSEFAEMLAAVDWHDVQVVVRKISPTITSPTRADVVLLYMGRIDAAKITALQLTFACSNDLALLQTTIPSENMHQNCRFRWADDFCTAIRFREENYKSKTCGSSSTTTLVKSAGLTEDGGANGSYGTDLVNALADGSISASSEKAAHSGASVTVNTTNDTFSLANHGLTTGDAVTFGGTAVPSPLIAATTYYVLRENEDTFRVSATPGGSRIDLTTSGTAVTVSTPTNFNAAQVKSGNANYWKISDLGDLGTLSQGYWTIPDAQAGLANAGLKPYIQFDFGSAKTPRIWRISSVSALARLEELPRMLVFFSSSNASDWTHESYAELPPRGGTLYDILIPGAASARYWRICIRNRWGQNKAYTMLNKVYAYEGGRNWWAHGTIRFASNTTTVALRGIARPVVESYSGEVVVQALPVAPANGDTFVIERGCGRTFNHCAERGNWENFGGFLDLPYQAVIRA